MKKRRLLVAGIGALGLLAVAMYAQLSISASPPVQTTATMTTQPPTSSVTPAMLSDEVLIRYAMAHAESAGLVGSADGYRATRMTLDEWNVLTGVTPGRSNPITGHTPDMPILVLAIRGKIVWRWPRGQPSPGGVVPNVYDNIVIAVDARTGGLIGGGARLATDPLIAAVTVVPGVKPTLPGTPFPFPWSKTVTPQPGFEPPILRPSPTPLLTPPLAPPVPTRNPFPVDPPMPTPTRNPYP